MKQILILKQLNLLNIFVKIKLFTLLCPPVANVKNLYHALLMFYLNLNRYKLKYN